MWLLNNRILNNQWVFEEIKEEMENCLEIEENKGTKIQHLWDTAKAVLREKFIAPPACLRKQGKPQINSLTLYFRNQKKNKQQPKVAEGRKQQRSMEINEIENKKQQTISVKLRSGS